MTHKTHADLPDDERDAFAAVCAEYQRAVSAFDVSWEEQYPDHGTVDHIERVVHVRAIGIPSEPVTYDAGPNTHWIDGFASDLAAGTFDPPGLAPGVI